MRTEYEKKRDFECVYSHLITVERTEKQTHKRMHSRSKERRTKNANTIYLLAKKVEKLFYVNLLQFGKPEFHKQFFLFHLLSIDKNFK